MSYKGNIRRIADFERYSFVCINFQTMISLFNTLTKVVNTVRIKNRFSKSNKQATERGGYRDLQLVMRIDSGVLVEIQIHLETFKWQKT